MSQSLGVSFFELGVAANPAFAAGIVILPVIPMGTRRLIDVVSKLIFGRDVADSEYNVAAAYRQWRWDTDQFSTANQRRAI